MSQTHRTTATPSVSTSVRLPLSVHESIKAAAEAHGCTASHLIYMACAKLAAGMAAKAPDPEAQRTTPVVLELTAADMELLRWFRQDSSMLKELPLPKVARAAMLSAIKERKRQQQ